MKKILKVLLALACVLSMTACGSTPQSAGGGTGAGDGKETAQSTTQTKTEAPAEIKDVYLFTCTFMDVPNSETVKNMENKVNEIMNPLGVNVHLEYYNVADFDAEVSKRLAAGDRIDLMNAMDYNYAGYIATDAILPLNDLLDTYGQDIKAALGTDFQYMLDGLTFNGTIYGIPQLSAKHTYNYAMINKTLADKYNMDLSSIKSYEDLEPLMLTIKENEPGVKPIIRSGITFSGTTAVCSFNENYEAMGDGVGVLMDADGYKVVDFYETEEYKQFLETVHRWYTEGLVSDDIATSGDRVHNYWPTGNAFCCIDHTTNYSAENEGRNHTNNYGVESVVVPISAPICSNLIYSTVIPQTSENPEGAMIFLNEMYKNTDLINTMYYGVEGIDWNLEDGFITGVDGSSAFLNCGTSQVMIWGNYFISTPTAGNEADAVTKSLEYTRSGKGARTLGFLFDTTPVQDEWTAIQSVLAEYQEGLEFGILDPETELPKFIQKLKDAGVDAFIAEKQRQLDAWAANK